MDTLVTTLGKVLRLIIDGIARVVRWWSFKVQGAGSRRSMLAWLLGGPMALCICATMLYVPFVPPPAEDAASTERVAPVEDTDDPEIAINSLDAERESEDASKATTTSEPSITPRASATATERPTRTPRPTRAPATATATEEASPTPEPTATNVPPTVTPVPPTATPVPPTAVPPTEPPPPTAVPPTAVPAVSNVYIDYVNKGDEYVDLYNSGGVGQSLDGWRLLSVKGQQECWIGGYIEAQSYFRVWAQTGSGGWSCGFGGPIWNNSESDPAELYDANRTLVSRYPG